MAERDKQINYMSNNNNTLSNGDHLDFEEKVAALDRQINELRKLNSTKGIDYSVRFRSNRLSSLDVFIRA